MIERRDNDGSSGDEQLPRRSRGSVLRTLGLGLAGLTAGALGAPRGALAADGDPLLTGRTNAGTTETELDVTPAAAIDSGFYVNVTNDKTNYGIRGDGYNTGVLGLGGTTGVMGVGTSIGGYFSGAEAGITISPMQDAQNHPIAGPPAGVSYAGDMNVDGNGVFWFCIADSPDGTAPGTWVRISHNGTNLLDSPQRAYDSRTTGGKLSSGEWRKIPIVGVIAAVPAEAVGIVGNLTVTETEGFGFVSASPSNATHPSTSNVNWTTSGVTLANALTVKLDSGGAFYVYAEASGASGAVTHVLVDVAGYIL
jgi:hypothetical protein